MNIITKIIILILTILYSASLESQPASFEHESSVSVKLLPFPAGEGIGGIGWSMDTYEQTIIVGATGVQGTGVANIYEHKNGSWFKSYVLKPSRLRDVEKFGEDVSIYGNRALVGCGPTSGCAFVYSFDGEKWNFKQHFIPESDEADTSFGNKVSIFDNHLAIASKGSSKVYLYAFNDKEWVIEHIFTPPAGYQNNAYGTDLKLLKNRLIIGQPSGYGAVHVYDFDGQNWSVNSIDNPLERPNTSFGSKINAIGDELLVGAERETRGGAVYLYELMESSWEQTNYFKPDEINSGEFFGSAIDISSNKILIGAYQDNAVDFGMGSAFLYEKNNDNWVFTQKIIPDGTGQNKLFGYSVGLTEDSLIVGARAENTVYFFGKDEGLWSENQSLTNTGANGARFGSNISLFENKALISSIGQESAYLYEYHNNSWNLLRTFEAPISNTNSSYAFSIDLNNDFVVVGDRYSENSLGSVHIYRKVSESTYVLTTLNSADGELGDHFGWSVSLQNNRLFIGAPGHSSLQFSGAVYIFEFDESENQWYFQTKLTNDILISTERFGESISSFDDKVMISSNNHRSAINIFEKDGTEWRIETKIGTDNGLSGVPYNAPNSMKLIENKAIIGVYNGGLNNEFNGLVNIFNFDGNQWHFEAGLSSSIYNDFGRSLDASDDTILIGAVNDDDLGKNAGAVYSFKLENGDWRMKYKFKGYDTYSKDNFGHSVNLYDDNKHMLVSSPNDDDHGSNSGSAYFLSISDGIYKNGFELNSE